MKKFFIIIAIIAVAIFSITGFGCESNNDVLKDNLSEEHQVDYKNIPGSIWYATSDYAVTVVTYDKSLYCVKEYVLQKDGFWYNKKSYDCSNPKYIVDECVKQYYNRN